jgi:tetratricopeptide (TPR) repeat protein
VADLKALYKEAFGAFSRRDFDAAIAGYRRVLELSPSFALGWQGLAEALAKHGDLDEAIRAIDRAIECEPTESLYHTSKSRFLQAQGKIPEAEEESMIASRLQSRGGL